MTRPVLRLLIASFSVVLFGLLGAVPPVVASEVEGLLRKSDPESLLAALKKEGMREKVEDRWRALVIESAEVALARNRKDLYPNPSIQAYMNRLGQILLPRELAEHRLLSFRIINDPLPYADALPTGTIYVSTGLVSFLENESQLAFVLMHEASHVLLSHQLQQIIRDEQAEKKAKRIRMIGAAAGALAGGALGGSNADVFLGGFVGFAGTGIGTEVVGRFRDRKYLRELQLESDRFAVELVLNHGFDVREAPRLLARMDTVVRRGNAAVGLAFANGKDLPRRLEHLRGLLNGTHRATIDSVLAGDGFQMASPRFNQLIAELKRDNGLLALESDLFTIAKMNLEEAAAIRTDDPLTMYGLGRLYRRVARTEEQEAQAAGYLKAAMAFDELRQRFPKTYLDLAVELLSREDPRFYPDIQQALKSYVALYQRRTGGDLPPEMPYVYDYLSRTGDQTWVAYRVSNIATEKPYQLTGDPAMDIVVVDASDGGAGE